MKCTVLLAIGLCVAAVLDVSESKVISDRAELCDFRHRWGRRYPEYRRRWRYYSNPLRRYHHLRVPKRQPLPSSCKKIECPTGELCHLIRPQCFDPPCQVVPVCVKKDKSGEWIDSEEWVGELPVLEKGSQHHKAEASVASESYDSKVKSYDAVLPYQSQILTDGSRNDGESGTEAAATYKYPTEVEATEVSKGYVNPGGSEISAQPVNTNSFDATQESVANTGNLEVPSESVSADSSNIFLNFLSLNNSESSGSPDHSRDRIELDGRTNTRMHKHKHHSNSRMHFLPGPGAYPEDLRIHNTLNPWTRRHGQEHRRVPSE